MMLYALGIGMGRGPMDERELPFVYEKDIKVLPTAVAVLASGRGGNSEPAPISHLNWLMLVHGEQKVELHKPLPSFGTFTATSRTIGAYDNGKDKDKDKDKGAVVDDETVWIDERDKKVATLTGLNFARGDGGFGGPSEGAPKRHLVPSASQTCACRWTPSRIRRCSIA
ncbi:hypothetical protein ACVWWG_009190 [Bradyrhizobium sp. LB7.2]